MSETLFQPPRQERSVATLDRFVRAAEELLAEGAFETATVDDIAVRASSSKGSFYARFGGKEAFTRCLPGALPRGCAGALVEAALTRELGGPASARRARGVRQARDRRLPTGAGRGAADAPRGRGPADHLLTVTSAKLNAHLVGLLTEHLQSRRGEHQHPSPKEAAQFAFLLVDASVRDAVFTDVPASDPRRIPPARLRREFMTVMATAMPYAGRG